MGDEQQGEGSSGNSPPPKSPSALELRFAFRLVFPPHPESFPLRSSVMQKLSQELISDKFTALFTSAGRLLWSIYFIRRKGARRGGGSPCTKWLSALGGT